MGTQEIALICDDPDAPGAEPWVHWVLARIPAVAKGLPEGLADRPAGLVDGRNSWGTTGYRGPFPPKGHGTHHYFFRLYALDAAMPEEAGIDKAHLLAAMKPHTLVTVELMGTYERK